MRQGKDCLVSILVKGIKQCQIDFNPASGKFLAKNGWGALAGISV